MLRIILSGANGAMGRAVTACVNASDDAQIVAGVDTNTIMLSNFPVFSSFEDITCEADVIIDFSHVSVLEKLLKYACDNNIPCVIATTGFSAEQLKKIDDASEKIAVFRSGNMSLGINLLIELTKEATKVIGNDFDIEIIEKHHNLKVDAPSGTALMIADGISETLENEPQYVYDRHTYRKKRASNEIGIHAVRGGTIVGEHEVIFAGHDEVITITHQAQSKEVFAVGSVNAAVFLSAQKAGKYDMKNLLSSKL